MKHIEQEIKELEAELLYRKKERGNDNEFSRKDSRS